MCIYLINIFKNLPDKLGTLPAPCRMALIYSHRVNSAIRLDIANDFFALNLIADRIRHIFSTVHDYDVNYLSFYLIRRSIYLLTWTDSSTFLEAFTLMPKVSFFRRFTKDFID